MSSETESKPTPNGNDSNGDGEDMVMEDVTDPQDTDVLCGRGGAALRHPGNQTYRRLVNLNKGLYITCLKTEKLKISRSIVAAIREQKGRFLEKDSKKGTWYDIGDKKAIEKTSQALREGQPKLRQKIVEMGGGAAGTQAFMESRYGHVGFTPEQVGLTPTNTLDPNHAMMQQHTVAQAQQLHHEQQQQQQQQQQQMGGPSVPPRELNIDMMNRLGLCSDVSALSLGGTSTTADERAVAAAASSMQPPRPRVRPSLAKRSSSSIARELGFGSVGDSQLSLMSDFSLGAGSFVGGTGSINGLLSMTGESFTSFEGNRRNNMQQQQLQQYQANQGYSEMFNYDAAQQQLQQQQLQLQQSNQALLYNASNRNLMMPPPTAVVDMNGNTNNSMTSIGMGGPSSSNLSTGNNQGGSGGVMVGGRDSTGRDKFHNMDRRHVFARMKYNRQPSGRNGSNNVLTSSAHKMSSNPSIDGMPDVYMVESNMSLYSNLSNVSAKEVGNAMDMKPAAVESAKVVDHSSGGGTGRLNAYAEVLGTGSRHSIMSGLSRISDTSFDQSIFSDLSKKIGNVSTRSIAMSEISAIDMQEGDNEDESTSNNTGFDFYPTAKPQKEGERKKERVVQSELVEL